MKPKVSIIVPVYNSLKDIRRCLDSIKKQKFEDFEVLLIDDGSTDGSGAVCDEYASKDSRLRVFHKQNGGVSSARNLGLDNACGEWICFVDADDIMHENGLFNMLSAARDADLVISEWAYLQHTGNTLYEKRAVDCTYNDQKEAILAVTQLDVLHWSVVWNKLYNFGLIQRYSIRFDERVTIEEDLLFNWAYIIHVNKMSSISDVSYFYCGNPGSAVCRRHSFVSFDTKMRKMDDVFNMISDTETRNKVKLTYFRNDLKICDSLYYDKICRKDRISTLLWLRNKAQDINLKSEQLPGRYNKLILYGLKKCNIRVLDLMLKSILGIRRYAKI